MNHVDVWAENLCLLKISCRISRTVERRPRDTDWDYIGVTFYTNDELHIRQRNALWDPMPILVHGLSNINKLCSKINKLCKVSLKFAYLLSKNLKLFYSFCEKDFMSNSMYFSKMYSVFRFPHLKIRTQMIKNKIFP